MDNSCGSFFFSTLCIIDEIMKFDDVALQKSAIEMYSDVLDLLSKYNKDFSVQDNLPRVCLPTCVFFFSLSLLFFHNMIT